MYVVLCNIRYSRIHLIVTNVIDHQLDNKLIVNSQVLSHFNSWKS
jgi:hypothetical protein